MKKAAEIRFVCQACGYSTQRWLGRCPSCQGWNSLVEERVHPEPTGRAAALGKAESPVWIDDIKEGDAGRIPTGIGEFDRVLGGGLVPGSFVLLGGDPGTGKSTLLLQAAGKLASLKPPILYVSAEESAAQVKLRASRLGVGGSRLAILAETRLEAITEAVTRMKPAVVIIDSIQTVWNEALGTAPGSVGQVRECAGALLRAAKTSGIAFLVVCHVTKDGTLAGPKVLEHLADCVLSFEGDRQHLYRILRADKNRYGSTSEIGIFEMGASGMREVKDAANLFLPDAGGKDVPGQAVAACMEGTRPLLVEVQALAGPSTYVAPQRRSQGIEQTRLVILLAVLEKRMGFRLSNQDVFVNVAGGLLVEEPAVDLACALAVASTLRDRPLTRSVYIGEIGLAGEMRPVAHLERRIEEAARLGFTTCLVPDANRRGEIVVPPGLRLETVKDLTQALDLAMP